MTICKTMIKDNYIRHLIIGSGKLPLVCLFAFMAAVAYCFLPVATGHFINGLYERQNCISLLVLMLGVSFCAMACEGLQRFLGSKYAHDFEVSLEEYLLNVANRFHPDMQQCMSADGLAGKFLRDPIGLSIIIREFGGIVIHSLVSFVLAIAIAFGKNLWLGVMFVMLLPVCVLVLRPFSHRFEEANHSLRVENDRIINKVYGFLHDLPYLRAMDAVFPLGNRINDGFKKMNKVSYRIFTLQYLFDYSVRGIVLIGEYGVLAAGIILVFRRRVSVGDVIALQLLFSQTLNAMTGILRVLPMFKAIKEAVASIEEMTLSQDIEKDSLKSKLAPFNGSVKMEHVGYRYPGQEQWAVRDFSLSAEKGKCIAICGANGAGKTTIAKLMCCYSMPCEGTILFDGVPQEMLNRDSIRGQIAVLFQDSVIIQGTIRENITLGMDYSDEELARIIELCGLKKTIERKDSGLDTMLECEGSLSGGERQRLALARALIRKPALAILDEVTNHLDAEGEELVCNLIPKLKKHCAIIVITHCKVVMELADELVRIAG